MAEAGASKIGDAAGTTINLNSNTVLETVPYAGMDIVCIPSEIRNVSVMQMPRRLAHLPPSPLTTLRTQTNGLPLIPSVKGTFNCNTCGEGRYTRTIPKARTNFLPALYPMVHSNICGPFSVPTSGGSRYCIWPIDEYSHRADVLFLKI